MGIISKCVTGTIISFSYKMTPILLHIEMPPIIPAFVSTCAGCATLLLAYPHLKERAEKWVNHRKAKRKRRK